MSKLRVINPYSVVQFTDNLFDPNTYQEETPLFSPTTNLPAFQFKRGFTATVTGFDLINVYTGAETNLSTSLITVNNLANGDAFFTYTGGAITASEGTYRIRVRITSFGNTFTYYSHSICLRSDIGISLPSEERADFTRGKWYFLRWQNSKDLQAIDQFYQTGYWNTLYFRGYDAPVNGVIEIESFRNGAGETFVESATVANEVVLEYPIMPDYLATPLSLIALNDSVEVSESWAVTFARKTVDAASFTTRVNDEMPSITGVFNLSLGREQIGCQEDYET